MFDDRKTTKERTRHGRPYVWTHMKWLPVLFAACVWLPTFPAVALLQNGEIPEKAITLSRTMCFGSCPSYELTLKADGTALYHGNRFVSKLGSYQGHFNPENFKKLMAMAHEIKFWELKKHYAVGYTDQASQNLIIVTSKGKYEVTEYGPAGPNELWALQTLVDGVAANIHDWKQTSK